MNIGRHINYKTTESEAIAWALQFCKRCYQCGIVMGRYRLSGSDLKGAASNYGARYARSRCSLLGRLRAAGVPFHEETGDRGLRLLVFGDA